MTKISFESKNCTFDVELLKVGYEHCDPKKLSESSMRYYFSLHYVLYGCGSLIVGGKEVKLTKGDLFLIYRGEEFEYFPDPSDPWSYVWIDFNGNSLSEFLNDCGFTEEKPYIRINDHSEFLLKIIQPLLDDIDGSSALSLVSSGNVLKLFGKLMENNQPKQPNRSNINASRRLKTFREILTFVNNNYRTNLAVQRACEETLVLLSHKNPTDISTFEVIE